jgi:hypothetical protein
MIPYLQAEAGAVDLEHNGAAGFPAVQLEAFAFSDNLRARFAAW